MIPEARSSKLVQGTIRDAGGALEDLAFGGTGRRKPRPYQVVGFCGDNTAIIWDTVV